MSGLGNDNGFYALAEALKESLDALSVGRVFSMIGPNGQPSKAMVVCQLHGIFGDLVEKSRILGMFKKTCYLCGTQQHNVVASLNPAFDRNFRIRDMDYKWTSIISRELEKAKEEADDAADAAEAVKVVLEAHKLHYWSPLYDIQVQSIPARVLSDLMHSEMEGLIKSMPECALIN